MYQVEFRPEALTDDLDLLPNNIRQRIMQGVGKRLTTEPVKYGMRLSKSLKGLWKLRCGDYRVVYEIKEEVVTIWAIKHRKDVYSEVEQRWFYT